MEFMRLVQELRPLLTAWFCVCTCRQRLRPYIDATGQIRNDFARCLLAEFFGTLLFQMFGGSAPAKDSNTPAANGFALVAVSEYLGRIRCLSATGSSEEHNS